MSKYDLGYNRAYKGLVRVLSRPNSEFWGVEEEFSDQVKSETENCICGQMQQFNAACGRVMLWKPWKIMAFNKSKLKKKSC